MCAGARDGYVVRAPPLAGKEEDQRLEAEIVKARPGHRFEKHSERRCLWQRMWSLYLVKLDNTDACRQTQITMIRSARVLESRTPLAARLLAPGLVILTIIVILPL